MFDTDVKYLYLGLYMHGCCVVMYSHCKSKHVLMFFVKGETAACS